MRFLLLLVSILMLPVFTPTALANDGQAIATPAATSVSPPSDASTTDAIQPSFFGMTAIRANDYPRVTFGTLGHPGVGVWPTIERQPGVYDFSFVDNFVNAAVQHGLLDSTGTVSMAITLGYTPQWYASNPKSCTDKNGGVTLCTSGPNNIKAWTDFITALMAHYNGVIMPHIRYYELWNEANTRIFWTGTYADMVNLAQTAYPIIHADPHSMLLTPSVVGPTDAAPPLPPFITANRVTWMAAYLDAGGARYADGGAFHGYLGEEGMTPYPMPEQESTSNCTKGRAAGCYGSILTEVTLMRQVFDQHGLSGKPMFDTEGSWGKGNLTDPALQTAWLARWYILQAGLHSVDNLQMVAWFAWDGTVFDWGSIEDSSGAPTQAAIAFNQVYNWLVGAIISQPCASAGGGTWICSLTRPGGYHAQVVWNTQGSAAFTPDAAFVDYRDLGGNTVKIGEGSAVTIGISPVLIETSPQGAD